METIDFPVIDAHAHCGVQDYPPPQGFEDYRRMARATAIRKVVMFPPVMEIYNRYDPRFTDDPGWKRRRSRANAHLLDQGTDSLGVIPYFFIWNDFAVEELDPRHRGIKWHRHAGEPEYDYDHPRCAAAVEEIRRRNLPVVLEEEMPNTIRFIEEIAPGVRVIIPHLGMLNGGYGRLAGLGIWERPDIYADTALAGTGEILDYLDRYGDERIFFGSDFPFGSPAEELEKVLGLRLPARSEANLLGRNLERLLAETRA